MKLFKCPDCSREYERDYTINYTTCLCGEPMKEVKSRPLTNETSKDDQMILKQAFERGRAKGKEETIEEIIKMIDNEKIKVNLK